MLKPVQFIKPRNVNGPLYQVGDVAGFMPELAAQLIAEGSAREPNASGDVLPAGPVAETPKAPEAVGTFSGYPHATADERQAARAGKKPGGKK